MNYLDIQMACQGYSIPSSAQLQQWVDLALEERSQDAELVIRIVDDQESQMLNGQYRQQHKPTNVLSFPLDLPDGIELDLLGDLVICAPVLAREAQEQHKPLFNHWAHIVIHGVLHLLGYDHTNDIEAEVMENKEITILKQLNINNPYLQVDSHER